MHPVERSRKHAMAQWLKLLKFLKFLAVGFAKAMAPWAWGDEFTWSSNFMFSRGEVRQMYRRCCFLDFKWSQPIFTLEQCPDSVEILNVKSITGNPFLACILSGFDKGCGYGSQCFLRSLGRCIGDYVSGKSPCWIEQDVIFEVLFNMAVEYGGRDERWRRAYLSYLQLPIAPPFRIFCQAIDNICYARGHYLESVEVAPSVRESYIPKVLFDLSHLPVLETKDNRRKLGNKARKARRLRYKAIDALIRRLAEECVLAIEHPGLSKK